VSHLNCRTTHKGIAQCVEVWRNFVFTPIWNTTVFWYAARPLKFRVSLCNRNGSSPPPKPLQKPRFICRHIAMAQFCQWEMLLATQLALFLTCPAVHCGLKYQHWPM